MIEATPTANARLPFRAGDFTSLAEGLDYAALGDTGVNFFSSRGSLERAMPYRELREEALALARRLTATQLVRGDRIGVIAETSRDFLAVFFACQYAGLVPVPLPLSINFGGKDAYVERLRGMLRAAGARAAVAGPELIGILREAVVGTAVEFAATADELATWPATDEALEPLGADDVCYIQYSSGSTSFPRGVLVTQAALAANARSIAVDGLALRPGDRCTSWLPLYHDMGLVGCCLTPVMTQISVDYLSTTAFARRPLVWLELISRLGGTISFGPTFGFELCARRAANGTARELDLSSWRVAGIGGEMIRPQALAAFADTFEAMGFDARAFVPSYGMAEATLAVTFSSLGRGVRVDRVARGDTFEREHLALPAGETSPPSSSRSFVVCGAPMPGYAVEIRDEAGKRLPERHVGRICIQGPSLMQGYFQNPEATAAVLKGNGWLDTGDMGYMVGGELVVSGRTKDLIIVGGRNIWPQDIEWAVEKLDAVRAGDAAAFSVGDDMDRERLVVVVECRQQGPAEQERLRQSIAGVVNRLAGVDCEIVLAPPRSLTFTTSGKLSRAAARDHYLRGVLRDLEAPTARDMTREMVRGAAAPVLAEAS
jgi:fatty-acyl-CoA synthase